MTVCQIGSRESIVSDVTNVKRAVTQEKTLTLARSIVKSTFHCHSAEGGWLVCLTRMCGTTADTAKISIQGHCSTWMSLAFSILTEGTECCREGIASISALPDSSSWAGRELSSFENWENGFSCLPAHISLCQHSETHVCLLLVYHHHVLSAYSPFGHVLFTPIFHWAPSGEWHHCLVRQLFVNNEMKWNKSPSSKQFSFPVMKFLLCLLIDCLFFVRRKRHRAQWRQTGMWTITVLLKIRGFLIVKCLVLISNILNCIKYICGNHSLYTNQCGRNRHLWITFLPILFKHAKLILFKYADRSHPSLPLSSLCLSWTLGSR